VATARENERKKQKKEIRPQQKRDKISENEIKKTKMEPVN
jgi:hypothetical protein